MVNRQDAMVKLLLDIRDKTKKYDGYFDPEQVATTTGNRNSPQSSSGESDQTDPYFEQHNKSIDTKKARIPNQYFCEECGKQVTQGERLCPECIKRLTE